MAVPRWVRRAFPVASLAIGLVVVGVVANRGGQGVGDLAWALPLQAHVLALGIMATELAARAGRWVIIARGVGVRLSFRNAVLAQLAGEGAGAVTPARLGADAAKVVVGGREGRSIAGPGALLVGEAFAEATVLTAFVVALFLAAPAARGLPLLGVLLYALFLVGLGGAALVVARRRPGKEPPGWLARLRVSPFRWRQFRVLARHLRLRTSRLHRLSPARRLAVLAVTAVHIAARLAVLPVLALSAGVAAPVLPLVLWPLFFFYVAILVPSPGGGGTVELGFAAALGGVAGPAVAGLLVWWRFYTFYLGALVGGIVLTRLVTRDRPPRTAAAGPGRLPASTATLSAVPAGAPGQPGVSTPRLNCHSRQSE